MDKRWTVIVLTLIGGVLYTLTNFVDISHWINTNYDMASYNPVILPISWGSLLVYLYMNYLKRPGAYYWFIGILWLVTNLYFTYGMVTYWLGL